MALVKNSVINIGIAMKENLLLDFSPINGVQCYD
jgi:hypothetical protein